MSLSTKELQFEREFYPLLPSLYNFALRLTQNEDDANDLVQDTFLKAWRFIESYQKGTNAKAWLFRIMRNGFINEYRRRSKEPNKIDYQDVEFQYNDHDDDRAKGPENLKSEVFQRLLGDEVTKALQELDVDFRLIILLSDVEEFSYEEIASILDVPIGTVRSRLHRARNVLKEKLKDYAKTFGIKDKGHE